MTEPIELGLVSESRLEPGLHEGIVTYNPTIELFAGAAGPTTLQIWRSNNQIVAKNSQRGEQASVQAVRWKPDGETRREPQSIILELTCARPISRRRMERWGRALDGAGDQQSRPSDDHRRGWEIDHHQHRLGAEFGWQAPSFDCPVFH